MELVSQRSTAVDEKMEELSNVVDDLKVICHVLGDELVQVVAYSQGLERLLNEVRLAGELTPGFLVNL